MAQAAAQLADRFFPGRMLGKYELLATIGTGGMASVILARQRGPGGFEKVVVVKVIHPHMAQDPAAIQMLLDEAKVAAQIDHPNVVHTYELGEADGTFYIAMEYLAGESLAQVIKHARAGDPPALTPVLAARIVADAAGGLHFAHELRDFTGKPLEIVHRDVSPGNLVVLYSGAVKVVDFGIAKAHGRVTSTRDGELKGKYGYMSPEQIKNEPLDRRSDVFSLGVVLWEALAQRRLFQSDSVAAILMQILAAERLPPSAVRPEVPPALDAIALRALAPEPRDRFQTAMEMKQALEDAIWQARCGAPEVAALMSAHFADRMEHRRGLLAQVAREPLSRVDLGELGAAFRDPRSAVGPAPGAATRADATAEPRRDRRAALILGGGVIAGVLAGMIVGFGGEASSPEPVAAPVTVPVAAAPPPRPALPEPVRSPPRDAEAHAAPVVTEPAPSEPEPAPQRGSTPSRPAPARPRPATQPARPARPARPPDELYQQATRDYLAGDFRAAETAYQQAARAGHAPAYRGLGFLYQRLGETAKARAALERYLRLRPDAKDAAAVRERLAQLGGT